MKSGISRQEGFTIVEMMMVLLIIGILVGIAVASYSFSLSRSQEAACRSNLKVLRKAITAFEIYNDRYPETLQELVPEYVEEGFSFRCPNSHEGYLYDPESGSVTCPRHPDA